MIREIIMSNPKISPTELFKAICMQDVESTHKLIKDGVDVNYVTHIKETPLIVAASVYNEQIIEELLEAGAVEGMKEAVLYAATQGKQEHLILTQEKVFAKKQKKLDRKLEEAIKANNLAEVIKLIAAGAHIDTSTNVFHCSDSITQVLNFVKFTNILKKGIKNANVTYTAKDNSPY